MHTDYAAELDHELKEIEAESMGWQPLERGVYLHQGAVAGTPDELVIQVVGIADVTLSGLNALLITG